MPACRHWRRLITKCSHVHTQVIDVHLNTSPSLPSTAKIYSVFTNGHAAGPHWTGSLCSQPETGQNTHPIYPRVSHDVANYERYSAARPRPIHAHITPRLPPRTPGGSVRGERANFAGLVNGCNYRSQILQDNNYAMELGSMELGSTQCTPLHGFGIESQRPGY